MSQKPLLIVKPRQVMKAEQLTNLKAQLSHIEDEYQVVVANECDISFHDVNLHESIHHMAEMIDKLVQSNARLIDAMVEAEASENEDAPAMTYMDGSKVSG